MKSISGKKNSNPYESTPAQMKEKRDSNSSNKFHSPGEALNFDKMINAGRQKSESFKDGGTQVARRATLKTRKT